MAICLRSRSSCNLSVLTACRDDCCWSVCAFWILRAPDFDIVDASHSFGGDSNRGMFGGCQDMFLRKKMDDDGWVPLEAIAQFPRVRQLTLDMNTLVSALRSSTKVELAGDAPQLIRARENWQNWVLPRAERDPQATSTMQVFPMPPGHGFRSPQPLPAQVHIPLRPPLLHACFIHLQ